MILCFGLPVYWLILGFWGQQNSPSPAFQPSTIAVIYLISLCDIAVDVPLNLSCLQICIKASKTYPFWKGCNILIELGSPPLCAVKAVASFLECRGNRPGPLFLFENGLPLSRSLLTDRLRAILLSAGLPGDFSSLSFRIGAATSAARAAWYSGSPHPSFGQLEKQCLQTIYLNSSRPHYSRRQIYGGLVWWVYFYLVLLTAFFVTASVLVASVCICRLEALASLAVAYCPSILPTHVSCPFCLASGGWYLALGNSLLGGSGPMAWHLPSIFIIAYRQVNKFKRAKGCSGYS